MLTEEAEKKEENVNITQEAIAVDNDYAKCNKVCETALEQTIKFY